MSVLSLPDAKIHLGMKDADNDTGLQNAIDSAEAVVAERVGSLTVGSSSTVRVAGGSQILLPAPLGTITAITTPDGQTVDLATLTINKPAGIVYFTDNLTSFSFDTYDVTYTRGWTTVPADLMWGLKECLREIWMARRGRGSGGGQGQQGIPGKTGWEQWVDPYRFVNVSAA